MEDFHTRAVEQKKPQERILQESMYTKLKTRQTRSIVLEDGGVVTFGVGRAWKGAGGCLIEHRSHSVS